jgi:cytochrome c oxidase subunit 2
VVLFVGIYSYDIYERMGGMAPLNDHSAMHHPATELMAMPASVGGAAGVAADAASTGPDPAAPRVWGGIGGAAGPSESLPVEVTAMQFAFIFHYPGVDITSGELHVPVDRPVELRMEARDVIHAFWVPQFRIKQDVIPGQPTVLSFTANRPGTYPIVCAELCGPYHGGMRTNVVVHGSDEFTDWLRKNTPASAAGSSATVASAGLTPTA